MGERLLLPVLAFGIVVGSVGLQPTLALVKSVTKEIREEEGERHSLRLAPDEVERLQALLLKRGILAGTGENADPGFELVASLSPLKPTAKFGSSGNFSVRYRGVVISAASDLPSYAEANAVDFLVGAGDLVASVQLEMGVGGADQRRLFLEIQHSDGSGQLVVTGKGVLLAEAGMEEAEALLTDPFLIYGTPDEEGSTYRIEIRAGAGPATGTLGGIRLYRLR